MFQRLSFNFLKFLGKPLEGLGRLFQNPKQILPYAVPLVYVLVFGLLGLLLEKLVIKRLERWVKQTKWKIDNIIVHALKGFVIVWFLFLGLYGAFLEMPLEKGPSAKAQTLLLVLFIVSVTLFFARIGKGFVQSYAEKAESVLPSASLLPKLISLVIYVIGLLIIFQTLGLKITPILGALGIGGIAIALALQQSLANFFAGFHILMSRKIRPGDFLRLSTGEEGLVVDISWRETTIKEIEQNIIIVPNEKMASAIVTNYSLPETSLAVRIPVGVSYKSDLKQVERVTIEVAQETMNAVNPGPDSPAPFIRYHTFDDFSINFTAVLFTTAFMERYLIQHEFVKRLHERYKRENIEIPFPIRTVQMRQ